MSIVFGVTIVLYVEKQFQHSVKLFNAKLCKNHGTHAIRECSLFITGVGTEEKLI